MNRRPVKLQLKTGFPTAVAALPAQALADVLRGPTLFDLRRTGVRPLFVSVLVHGNETSGWDAVRHLTRELLEASVLLFVGNVAAAKVGLRTLPGRPDFNRVWQDGDSPEAAVAKAVAQRARAANPWLAVDIHNTTGRNPPYSVVADTDAPTLAAARAFAEHALLATQPNGFQTGVFANFCTAITLEVGMPGDPASTDRATEFLRHLLHRPQSECAVPPLALFETVARVTLGEDAVIVPEMQRFNFRTAPVGATLVRQGAISARTADGRDVSDAYFTQDDEATVLKRPSVIASYTGDMDAARQDCLCYLLEPARADG